MADDNNFSLGDILWEYADYAPPDPAAPPPSGPAPVQPVSAPAPVRPREDAPPSPEPPPPQGPVPPANAVPPGGEIPPANAVPPANAPPGTPPAEEQEPPPAPVPPVQSGESGPAAPPAETPAPAQESPAPPQAASGGETSPPQTPGQEQGAPDDDLIFFPPSPQPQQKEPDGAEAGKKPPQGQTKTPAQGQAKGQKPAKPQPGPQGQTTPQAAAQGKPAPQKPQPGQKKPGPQARPGQKPGAAEDGAHLKSDRKKKAVPPPPDVPLPQLAQFYRQRIGTSRQKCVGGAVFSVLLLLMALLESGFVPFLRDLVPEGALLPASLVLFVLTLLPCQDVLKIGLIQLTNRTPDADTLALFAAVFTAADGLTLLLLHLRTESLPFFAPCALMLTFHQIGNTCSLTAKAIACETAAIPRGYAVTLDPNVLGGQPAFRKWLGTTQGIGSQMRTPSLPYRQFQKLTPVLLAACFLVPLVTTVLHHQPRMVLWSLAALFTTASTLGASLSFDLPFRAAAGRLRTQGAALAGWPGVDAARGNWNILLGDFDLFPPGAVQFTSVKALNGFPLTEGVSLASSVIRASGSGLGILFDRLRQRTGAEFLQFQRVELVDRGIIARAPDGSRVLVGDSTFMAEHSVPLPKGALHKDAVYCAQGMTVKAMFVLRYDMHPAILPCIRGIFANGLRPLLATRDFNLTPARLRARERLPLDDDCFPDLKRRVDMSSPDHNHGHTKIAFLASEGLVAYSQSVIAARRIRRAALLSSFFVRLGAVIGVILTATLSSAGATGAMCAWNLALFLLLWLVPVLLLSLWARW